MRKKVSQLRKYEQQYRTSNEGQNEGQTAPVDHVDWDTRDTFYNEHTHRNGRDYDADHDSNEKHDTEPQGVIAELDYSGVKDRRGKYHERQVIDERSSNEVDEDNEQHYEMPMNWEPYDLIRCHKRNFSYGKKMAENYRSRYEREHHAGGLE